MWNTKEYIVDKVANHYNPYNSDFFIYADTGSFRDQAYKNWPNLGFIQKLKPVLKNRILLGLIFPVNASVKHNLLGGGFFAGSSVAVANWARNFYALHDEMFDKGDFVGKDQTLFNVIAFQRNPESTVKLKTYQNNGCSYNSWFFFSLILPRTKIITVLLIGLHYCWSDFFFRDKTEGGFLACSRVAFNIFMQFTMSVLTEAYLVATE